MLERGGQDSRMGIRLGEMARSRGWRWMGEWAKGDEHGCDLLAGEWRAPHHKQ